MEGNKTYLGEEVWMTLLLGATKSCSLDVTKTNALLVMDGQGSQRIIELYILLRNV